MNRRVEALERRVSQLEKWIDKVPGSNHLQSVEQGKLDMRAAVDDAKISMNEVILRNGMQFREQRVRQLERLQKLESTSEALQERADAVEKHVNRCFDAVSQFESLEEKMTMFSEGKFQTFNKLQEQMEGVATMSELQRLGRQVDGINRRLQGLNANCSMSELQRFGGLAAGIHKRLQDVEQASDRRARRRKDDISRGRRSRLSESRHADPVAPMDSVGDIALSSTQEDWTFWRKEFAERIRLLSSEVHCLATHVHCHMNSTGEDRNPYDMSSRMSDAQGTAKLLRSRCMQTSVRSRSASRQSVRSASAESCSSAAASSQSRLRSEAPTFVSQEAWQVYVNTLQDADHRQLDGHAVLQHLMQQT